MTTQQKKKKQTYKPPFFKIGQEVYLTAFLKKYPGKFFICKAEIKQRPEPNARRVYKIRIVAVADAPVGSNSTPLQTSLLGRTITKRENEISLELPLFMRPKEWIEVNPDDKTKGKR